MVCGVLALWAGGVAAQQPQRPPACTAPEHRQFDFWVGDWIVEAPNGQVAGTNVITRDLGGCVLTERWTGSRGGVGSSFNIYDAAGRRWHQTWVDNGGTLLLLDGRFENGRMVLQGEGPGANHTRVLNRITWEPLEGGRVRQHWETSPDGGATWTTAFLGTYRQRS